MKALSINSKCGNSCVTAVVTLLAATLLNKQTQVSGVQFLNLCKLDTTIETDCFKVINYKFRTSNLVDYFITSCLFQRNETPPADRGAGMHFASNTSP